MIDWTTISIVFAGLCTFLVAGVAALRPVLKSFKDLRDEVQSAANVRRSFDPTNLAKVFTVASFTDAERGALAEAINLIPSEMTPLYNALYYAIRHDILHALSTMTAAISPLLANIEPNAVAHASQTSQASIVYAEQIAQRAQLATLAALVAAQSEGRSRIVEHP